MGSWVWAYAFGALAYATVSTSLFVVAIRLARPLRFEQIALLYVVLTFVFMTQHPFPSRGSLICPVATATPNLTPFAYVSVASILWEKGHGISSFLANRTIAASTMNFMLFAAIGFAAANAKYRLHSICAFGVLLSLAIEMTQLTGLWGIYPCAYR